MFLFRRLIERRELIGDPLGDSEVVGPRIRKEEMIADGGKLRRGEGKAKERLTKKNSNLG